MDLIIMGSHGTGGREEWFMGSNTQKVARSIYINLLVVKKAHPNYIPKSAVFVSGLNMDDQNAFKSFLEKITLLNIQNVHILTIDTSAWFSQPNFIMHEVQKYFKKIATGYNCKAHFYKDYSIQSVIRYFIETHNIYLVGISYRERNAIKIIFLGSNVEMLINHSNKPTFVVNN